MVYENVQFIYINSETHSVFSYRSFCTFEERASRFCRQFFKCLLIFAFRHQFLYSFRETLSEFIVQFVKVTPLNKADQKLCPND